MSYTIYLLCLNDMRMPKYEMLQPVCWAQTKEALKELLDREKAETYRDPHHEGSERWWGKSYRRGGILEWCNPPYDCDEDRHFPQYTIDREPSGPEMLDGIPHVSGLLEAPMGWISDHQEDYEVAQFNDQVDRMTADGADSGNRPIHVGDKVRFRGQVYTIKEFMPTKLGGAQHLAFEEEVHVSEVPTELTVDKVE